MRRRHRHPDLRRHPAGHRAVDEAARAIRAFDPAGRRQVQIDAGMAERSVAAIARRHHLIDLDDLENRHQPIREAAAGGAIDRAGGRMIAVVAGQSMIRYLAGVDGKTARRQCPGWLALAAGLLLLAGCALPAEPGLQVASAAPSRGATEVAQPRITD